MNLRILPLALLTALSIAGTVPGVARAADDKCVEACDEETDACMSDAAGDEKKEKACDEKYDECIKKCG